MSASEMHLHSATSSPMEHVVEPRVGERAMPKKRGFAQLSRDQIRELGRRGGVAAHRGGRAHEYTREEARVAGRKGGLARHANASSPAEADESPIEGVLFL